MFWQKRGVKLKKIKHRKDKQGNHWIGSVRFTKGGFVALGLLIAIPLYIILGWYFG
jgi:hypothetical protein